MRARGTAGFAHVSCLAEQAKILYAEAVENKLGGKALEERFGRWHTCSLCGQGYHGVVMHALGWACWKMYLGRPEDETLNDEAAWERFTRSKTPRGRVIRDGDRSYLWTAPWRIRKNKFSLCRAILRYVFISRTGGRIPRHAARRALNARARQKKMLTPSESPKLRDILKRLQRDEKPNRCARTTFPWRDALLERVMTSLRISGPTPESHNRDSYFRGNDLCEAATMLGLGTDRAARARCRAPAAARIGKSTQDARVALGAELKPALGTLARRHQKYVG